MIWILLSILVVSVLINRLFLQRSILSFRYYLEASSLSAEIGDKIEILSVVENHKELPVSFVELREHYPAGLGSGEYRTSMSVGPFERVKRKHEVEAMARGVHRIENGRLVIGDFLGFSREYQRYPLNKEWVVYPKRRDLFQHIRPVDSTLGEESVQRWILPDPLMIRGVREYTGLESMRNIHWPSSLRQGSLMVREYDFTAEKSCLIVLNNQTSRPSWEKPKADLIERTIELTRSLAEELDQAAVPFSLRTTAYNYLDPTERGYTIHDGLGEAHMLEVLDVLGRIDYKVGPGLNSLLRMIQSQRLSHVTVVLMTPVLLEDYLAEIELLVQRVSRLVVITQTSDYVHQLPAQVEVYQGVNHA